MTARATFTLKLIHPRYWPTWLYLCILWLAVQLPFHLQVRLGRYLGNFMFLVAGRRRHIAATNINLCFPGLSDQERAHLLKKNFESMGIAIFETGIAWFWPNRKLNKLAVIEHPENLEKSYPRGVILLSLHFTTLEIGAAILRANFSVDGTYRQHKNELLDFIQLWGRERRNSNSQVLSRDNVRPMVKNLLKGRLVWYAPDQDYGKKHSVFVDFFGVSAATITATSTFARLGHADIIPFTQTRLADDSGYKLTIHPAMTHFPSNDDHRDARRINEFVEQQILAQPEQYLWAHRRFKTRPEGESSLYQKSAKTTKPEK